MNAQEQEGGNGKQAPRLRPFSWWSIDIAEDLDILGILTSKKQDKESRRRQRDAFAMLIWAHLEEHDPAFVEAEIAAGKAADHGRDFRLRPEAILSIPDLPLLLADFEEMLRDKRLSGLVKDGVSSEGKGPE